MKVIIEVPDKMLDKAAALLKISIDADDEKSGDIDLVAKGCKGSTIKAATSLIDEKKERQTFEIGIAALAILSGLKDIELLEEELSHEEET